MKKSRKILQKFALLIIAVVLTLIFAEVFIRIFAPQPTYKEAAANSLAVFKKSENYLWELAPGKKSRQISPYGEFDVDVRINEFGKRDFPGRNKGKIAVIGDSFTFGHGVELNETYAKRLEEKTNISVVNLGYVAGFSPDSYYAYIKKNIDELKPEILIVGFTLDNDMSDIAFNNWEEVDENGLPIKVSTNRYLIDNNGRLRQKNAFFHIGIIEQVHFFLSRNSHLYVLFARGMQDWFFAKGKRAPLFREEYDKETKNLVEKTERILLGIKKSQKEKIQLL